MVQMRPGRRWIRIARVIHTPVVMWHVVNMRIHLILATATGRVPTTPMHHPAIHTPSPRLARIIRVTLIRHIRGTRRRRWSLINRLVMPVRTVAIASGAGCRGRWTRRRIQRIPHRTRPLCRAAGRGPRDIIPVIAIRTAHCPHIPT